MKKLAMMSAAVMLFQFSGSAQVHNNAFGIRLGTPSLFGGSIISYQRGINPNTRMDFGINLSGGVSSDINTFSYARGSASIYYQKVYNIKGGLNWFAGAGIRYSYSHLRSPLETRFQHNFAIGPQMGLEYDFNRHKVPLLLAIDYSPTIGVSYDGSSAGGSLLNHSMGLSLRYTLRDKSKSDDKPLNDF